MHVKTTMTTMLVAMALCLPVADAGDKHKKGEKRMDDKHQMGEMRMDKKHQASAEMVNRKISDWPEASREAAQATLDEYGPPDEMTESMLIWRDNGEWKKTVVTSEPIEHNFPFEHEDVIFQTIAYDVPVDKISDISEFDGSVSVERTAGTMTAGCASEGGNKLALNLAHQIIEGEMSVAEAREASAEAMEETLAGNPPENVRELAFDVQRRDTADPDEAVIQVAGLGQ